MYRLASVAACLCLAAWTAPAQDPNKTKQIEQEVKQAIKEFDQATARGDVARIESFLAEEYLHTDVLGQVRDKAAWLEVTLKPLAGRLKAGEFNWEIYHSDDIQVRVYGDDIAVAVGRWNIKANIGRRVGVGRFTHLWVKRQGRWQRAIFQGTLVPEPESIPESEARKVLIRRLYQDGYVRGNHEVIDSVFAPEYLRHDSGVSAKAGRDIQYQLARSLPAAFPDLQVQIDFIIAEGDKVAARWTIRGTNTGPFRGNPPTGKPVEFSGINVFRFETGKVVEVWNHRDDLHWFQQMGLVPQLPQR